AAGLSPHWLQLIIHTNPLNCERQKDTTLETNSIANAKRHGQSRLPMPPSSKAHEWQLAYPSMRAKTSCVFAWRSSRSPRVSTLRRINGSVLDSRRLKRQV